MIIRRSALLAVLPATTSDDPRYCLNSIQADPSRHTVCATNGHVLLIATDRSPQDDADFPSIVGAEFHGNPDKPILIPADVAKSMIDTMPKKSVIPILAGCQVSRSGSEDTITVSATDPQTPRTATIKQTDLGMFPAYKHVFPQADRPSVRMILSVKVLETLLKAAKAVQHRKTLTGGTIAFDVPISATDAPRPIEPDPDKPGEFRPIKGQPGESAIGIAIGGTDEITVSGVAMVCRP